MIGNDIVDLNNMKINWNRPRFLEKIFTENEQQIISNSNNQHQTVWLLWSMKEAAYKVYVQQFEKQFFNPKKLVCYISSSTKGFVTFENEIYFTSSSISENYVYTIASLNKSEDYKSGVFKVENTSYSTQSESLKNRFLLSISREKKLNIKDVTIRKNAFGIPELLLNDVKFPFKMSLTHCGCYGGFTYY
jgi:phosphopantetheine--protein transferase-like protein